MGKQLFYKLVYFLSLVLVLGFISAFIYYYISDGIYASLIPIVVLVGIDLVCNMFPQNRIVDYIRFITISIVVLFILSIIIRTVLIHPIIVVGFILSMILFITVLYYRN